MLMLAALVVSVGGSAQPVLAGTGPWSDYYGEAGVVTVGADRKQIRVCDLNARDDLKFKAEFATDNPIDPTIYSVKVLSGGCESDRTYISRVKVFKLCVGSVRVRDVVWDQCNPSVWITGSS
ncbi:hypothetical protein [Microtetraspora fusca]|uniref:hypothetical protein n=1 Tax=Microtetraspora fusca TaxID=1997 RepID=UPI000AFDD110|nr:hypothetical protein [Microtetraspora fusca]